jgi:hypothetical protein
VDVEDDLLWDSLDGGLAPSRAAEFLNRLKSTRAGREDIAFAEALHEVLNRLRRDEMPAQPRRPRKRNVLLIAATLAVVVAGVQFVRNHRAEPHPTAVLTATAPPPAVVSFFLTAAFSVGPGAGGHQAFELDAYRALMNWLLRPLAYWNEK